MPQMRKLYAQEIALARTVYRDSVPYDRVYIADLAIGQTPVTLAGMDLPRHVYFTYSICWPAGFHSIMDSLYRRTTLIHELCHVWQGEHGVWPTFYMGQSITDQLSAGIKDIVKQRRWRGWENHRAEAYTLHASDWGKSWNAFGVEQQASIIETWFLREADRRALKADYGPGVTGGNASPFDPRFSYVRDVIRAGKRSAPYRTPASTLAPGGDREIKAMQDKLVALGYLDGRYADGLVGRSHSATLDAVRDFQRRNGLQADRELGGAHSLTRRKLGLPIEQLATAP